MRSKRILAMLLSLCLVLSALSPAVLAVEPGKDALATKQDSQNAAASEDKNQASRPVNSLLLSGDDAQKEGVLTLRDNPLYQLEVNSNTQQGAWSFTPSQEKPNVSLRNEQLNAVLEELSEAAQLFDKNEVVSAFVVMDGKALAESYSSMSQVSADEERKILDKQNLVIQKIEQNVLEGNKLTVRYQFTYLANAFSVRTEFKNLAEIAKIEGVKSVFVMPTYDPMSTTASPNTFSSGAMTGVHTVWENLKYTGAGMKIAVVDTGLDLDHPSFAADPATTDASMTVTDIDNVLALTHAYAVMGGDLAANGLYRSAKVPFAFNYVDANLTADHSSDMAGDHGSHVAGIAAANKVEGTSVVGMAPDAQVIVMKFFGAAGGAYMDDYVAAIEDAMILGCDVVNLSLGSDNGFTNSGYAFADSVFANLEKQDIIATISAGNSGVASTGNMWGTDLNRTQNPENGVVGSPSTYTNAFSIASAENSVVMTEHFVLADGTKVFFMPSIEALYGYVPSMEMALEGDFEYVVIDGLGAPEQFFDAEGNSLVEGKIAVVKRGELSFSEKVMNAAAAGAVACLIWNNNPDDDIFTFGMTTAASDGSYPPIPASLITVEAGQLMADAEVKTMTVTAELAPRAVEGGQMSSFSSWGTTSDLRLLPDITGIGGNVYSCYDGGGYGIMSGTSMSAPQVAGVSALVMQYLKDRYPELDTNDGQIREMAMALLMSTATPVIDERTGLEASPRQQGAGLVDADAATTAASYLTVNGGRPKVEMLDSLTGVYTFTFEIHNTSDVDQTYTMSSSLLTEDVIDYGIYFMAGYERELTGEVDYGAETVTVFPGESVTVNVRVTLSEEDKAYFNQYWENGGYVEGYIYLDSENDVDLNLPFFGFYGDWTAAPMFDTAFWWCNDAWGAPTANGLPSGDQYQTILFTDLGGSDWVLGFNPYSGAMIGEDGNVIYDPANNVLSPNGDGILDELTEIYVSLLRNAKELSLTWKDGDKILQRDYMMNVGKSAYNSNYGQIVPWVASWYYGDMPFINEFTPVDGQNLTLTFEAVMDYPGHKGESFTIPIVIDNQKPELVSVYEAPQTDGSNYLVIDAKENHNLASVVVMNASGSRILNQVYDFEFEKQSDGTYRAFVDITGLGSEFVVALCDYAANESYYNVTYTADVDGNLPVMDTSLLYGYRVYDTVLGYFYGADHMYGWVSMNKPENDPYGYGAAWVTTETDDYTEYYSLTAAEYAGGKIFAFDAGGNFLIMNPGLWDRQIICATELNVLDMAFDDTTDTMYVLSKDGSLTTLYSIDLLSAELTEVADFGYYTYAPYTITVADDGTMYAARYNSDKLYKVVEYWGYYDTQIVTDAEGNEIVLTDAYGAPVRPKYNQSMTFADGKIYWAYFSGNSSENTASLITIDVSDYSYTAAPFATIYGDPVNQAAYSDTGVVGLLTLDETEFQFPEGDELFSLTLNAEWAPLSIGQTLQLKATPTPWNYKLTSVNWTSSDESVATVDNKGLVTAVSEGNATITAEHNGITASCEVTVANIKGAFYAYDFYGLTGLLEVETATMAATVVGMPVANDMPVTFIAGDYNGHNNCFYGYDMNYQFHKWDLTTGEVTAIGQSVQANIVDMAYDYTTGLLYALVLDYMTGMSNIYMVDCNTGALIDYALSPDALMTLAIDNEGNMFTMTAYGSLCSLMMEDGADYGYDVYIAWTMPLLDNLGELNYAQSMAYDWENDVIIWANPETQNVFWIDYNADVPYAMPIGNPTPYGMQMTGMFTVPAEIPALPDVAVESVTVADMTLMTGAVKMAPVSILPLNANGYTVTMQSADETVATVVDGLITAVSAGETDITVTVADAVSGETFEEIIHVTTIQSADNLYGFLSGDLATYMSGIWFNLPVTDTRNPIALAATEWVIFAGEYYDGKLYAVGYNGTDYYDTNWYLFTMDPETFEIENQVSVGEDYPFVYDMTYDYATSTMYCVAGQSDNDTDLYAMNMETGALTLLMQIDPMLMSLAAAADGKLYGIAQAETIGDMWDPWAPVEYIPSVMYALDPMAGTIEEVGSTGIVMNVMSSMSYDYDTGKMYWTGLNRNDASGGLCLMDLETGEATVLDKISTSGASVTSLYFICDEYPAEPEASLNKILMAANASTFVGQTIALNPTVLPFGMDAAFAWTSSDETVATVDENGVVTGVAAGTADITVTVTVGESSLSAVCKVAVLAADASFLTYNVTDLGWALISRADGTVTQLTSGEDEAPVTALTMKDDVVYGADAEGNFFTLNPETFERTVIATADAVALINEFYENQGWMEGEYVIDGHGFTVRDMAYDAANDRMLILGVVMQDGWELYGGASIYELDLTEGTLTILYNFMMDNGVQGIAVDQNGTVYFNSTYMDYYTSLDLETGARKDLYTIQRMGLHASSEHDHDLYFDELTGRLFHLNTGNGDEYRLFSMGISQLDLVVESAFLGEADEYGYGDWFSGLVYLPESAGIHAPVYEAAFTSGSTTLNGMIGLNFYFAISEDAVNHADTKVVFTHNDKTVEVPMSEAKYNEQYKDYGFTYYLTSVEMADEITAQVFVGDMPISEAKEYSIQQYAMRMIAKREPEDALCALLKTMLNYGAAAQVEFGYNTEDLANAQLDAADQIPAEVDAAALEGYKRVVEGTSDVLKYNGTSLILESGTKIRVYFLYSGENIDEVAFAINGEPVTPVYKNGEYYIEVTDVKSNELDDMFTFTADGLTVKYGVLTYVANKLTNGTETTQTLVKALYAYSQAAEAYFG